MSTAGILRGFDEGRMFKKLTHYAIYGNKGLVIIKQGVGGHIFLKQRFRKY